MTVFFATIAFVTIAILAYAARRQFRSNQATREHCLHLAEEVQELRRQLGAVVNVIERSGGGVEKRIREQQEIMAAITARQPVLFKDEPGLKHWLNAQNVFLRALKSAVASLHV